MLSRLADDEDLSTPFSGFRRRTECDNVSLQGDFQLPFRDSQMYVAERPADLFFQLPFRDSSGRFLVTEGAEALSTPFSGFVDQGTHGDTTRGCLSTPFSGFLTQVLLHLMT